MTPLRSGWAQSMTQPHIAYIVREGDDNEELRYSLRSLAKHLPHASVTIAGYKPSWVTGVTYLRVPALERTKNANIRANVRAVCARIPNWVLMQDDIFIMRPIDAVPAMRHKRCADVLRSLSKRDGPSAYAKSIGHAGEIIVRDLGIPDPYCYDAIHVPQHIDSEAMVRACDMADKTGCGRILTFHGNIVNRPAERVPNAKSPEGWQGRTFISTNDQRWANGHPTVDAIRDTFKEASPYERT